MGRAFECRRRSKEARWDKMSKVFPKLAKSISLAAREGGEDADMNPRLRTAILNAKAQNMPKDKIDAAIQRGIGKDAANFTEIVYEARLPHGVMVFIECATDNTNRTVVNLRTILSKKGGEMVNSGSLTFLFDRKAVVEFLLAEGQEKDEVELELIDHGLEELEVDLEDSNYLVATAAMEDFGRLQAGVEQLGLEVRKSSLQRIASTPVEISAAQMEEIEPILDAIEDDDDVQAVFSNLN